MFGSLVSCAGLKPGTVVVSREVVDTLLRPYQEIVSKTSVKLGHVNNSNFFCDYLFILSLPF